MEHGINIGSQVPYEFGLVGRIFPKGYDNSIEVKAREVASRIGYNVICDLGQGTIEDVDIADICPCQQVMSKTKLIDLTLYVGKNEVPGVPSGIRMDGKICLLDGHHRVAAQIMRGTKKVKIHLTDIDNGTDCKENL